MKIYRGVVIRSNKWVCIRSNKCGSIRSSFFSGSGSGFIRSIFSGSGFIRSINIFFYFCMVSLFFEKSCICFFAEMRRYKVSLFFKIHVYTIFAKTRNYKVSFFRPKTSYNV